MCAAIRMIFVVGASRSGTTMLNRVLGQNGSILALNELHYFGDLWDPMNEDVHWNQEEAHKITSILLQRIQQGIFSGSPDKESRISAKHIVDKIFRMQNSKTISPEYLFDAVLQAVAVREGRSIVTDQTPRNIFYAKQLLHLYTNARVIHIIRDPRAVSFSQRKRWTKKRLGAKEMPWSNVLRVLANYHPITMSRLWKQAVLKGRELKGHSRYYEIRFESLVHDPVSELERMSDFLDVPFDKAMLDVPQVGSSHNKHDSNKRGISASYSSDWNSGLPKGDVVIIEKTTDMLMRSYGYEAISKAAWYPRLIFPLIRLPIHALGVLILNPKRALILTKALLQKR